MNLKQIISKVFGIKIEDGIGITTDNCVKLSEIPRRATIGTPIGSNSPLYEVNPNAGQFELLGHRISANKTSVVVLRNTLTGDTFSLSYNLFTMLFKKKISSK